MKLLIASKNTGKIREIRDILEDLPFHIITLSQLNNQEEVEETGNSFEENAILKAKNIGEKYKILTLAEDSGLAVEVLEGRPGVYSARYTAGTDKDRVHKLLKELEGISKEKRTARFKAVVALYLPVIPSVVEGSLCLSELASARDSSTPLRFARNDDFKIVTFEGVSEGYITEKPLGRNGFGYDPIFYNLKLKKTNAQASPEEKNRVSHRAIALIQIKNYLLKKSSSVDLEGRKRLK